MLIDWNEEVVPALGEPVRGLRVFQVEEFAGVGDAAVDGGGGDHDG